MKPGTPKIMTEYPEVGKLYRVHPWNIVHVPPSFIPSGPGVTNQQHQILQEDQTDKRASRKRPIWSKKMTQTGVALMNKRNATGIFRLIQLATEIA